MDSDQLAAENCAFKTNMNPSCRSDTTDDIPDTPLPQPPPEANDMLHPSPRDSESSSFYIPPSQDETTSLEILLTQRGDHFESVRDDEVKTPVAFRIEDFQDVEAKCNDSSQNYEEPEAEENVSFSIISSPESLNESRNTDLRLNRLSPKVKIGKLNP